MAKTAAFDIQDREFVEELSQSLRKRSVRTSPTKLAQLVGVAFQNTFAGTSREDKLANSMARGLSVREKMAAEEGGSMSAEETARYLRMTKQSVLNLYHSGKLLAWKIEKQGAFRFPVWQFTEYTRLAGLEDVLARLNEAQVLDDWGKIGFFLQTSQLLGNKRPLDLLRENKLDQVLKAADAYVE
jgi:hypothetical protein